jgi:hypothetical protein
MAKAARGRGRVRERSAKDFMAEGEKFQSLSVGDLLDARDAYHVHLSRKKNVIGTAVGKYLIRKKGVGPTEPRTLHNSEIRPYSWPCLLVFVEQEVREDQFDGKKLTWEDRLPRRLYLPDGREIPVCVVASRWKQRRPPPVQWLRFPGGLIGGGYPVLTRVQGEERWATMGCHVSDGRFTYALTNAHVTGGPGEPLATLARGNERQIGVSAEKSLSKKPFGEVYEGLGGKHCLVNLDVGLIEFDELDGTTSRVFGIDGLRGMADVNHDTVSLKLIGCPVRGFGCASGEMRGQILGLFYRYAQAGGYDYVADYLIGPRKIGKSSRAAPFAPAPGDSGTLFVVDDPKRDDHLKAIALLWGGQRDVPSGGEQPYALATNLSTICRLLDVRLVCDLNAEGVDPYFGAYAHVTLPSLCLDALADGRLRKLMFNNRHRFSMDLPVTGKKDTQGLSKRDFVLLSDVSDLMWKARGGKFLRGKEGPNHFADMDQAPKDREDLNRTGRNRTLLDLCLEDEANITPLRWLEFYKEVQAEQKGALPFRIAQIYDAMRKAVLDGDRARFVGAAGILTHYVFDAVMPLHISYLHHGDPDGPKKTVKQGKKEKEVPIAYNVHDEFDNDMMEYHIEELRERLPELVAEAKDRPLNRRIATARDAAVAAVGLMGNTVKACPPADIVKEYTALLGRPKRERCDILWETYGEAIMGCVAEGAVFCARLWEAAWENCGGDDQIGDLTAVDEGDLRELYQDREFLVSLSLDELASAIEW